MNLDKDSWKQWKGKVKPAQLKEVKVALLAWLEQDKRVTKARAAMKRPLRGEALEEAQDELSCSIQDRAYHEKLYRTLISSLLPEDVLPDEDAKFESDPREMNRKASFEKELGRELSWKEYWRLLEGHYAEKAAVDRENYEDSVAGYVHRFDSQADLGGSYDSDLGKMNLSDALIGPDQRLRGTMPSKR